MGFEKIEPANLLKAESILDQAPSTSKPHARACCSRQNRYYAAVPARKGGIARREAVRGKEVLPCRRLPRCDAWVLSPCVPPGAAPKGLWGARPRAPIGLGQKNPPQAASCSPLVTYDADGKGIDRDAELPAAGLRGPSVLRLGYGGSGSGLALRGQIYRTRPGMGSAHVRRHTRSPIRWASTRTVDGVTAALRYPLNGVSHQAIDHAQQVAEMPSCERRAAGAEPNFRTSVARSCRDESGWG